MSKLIVFTGPDGSGKSTLIEKLGHTIPNATTASIWDSLASLSGINKGDIQNHLRELSPRGCTLFLAHALVQAYSIAQKKQNTILFDSYVYKYGISQKVAGDDLADKILFNLPLLNLPKPDLVFYLECQPETTLQRKLNIGLSAYESGFAGSQKELKFLDLQIKAQPHWNKLLKENPHWIIVPEHMSLEAKVTHCSFQIHQLFNIKELDFN